MTQNIDSGRRRLLGAAVSVLGLGLIGGAAYGRVPTPPQTRGPFYPVELPLDRDNDLVRIKGHGGIAGGEISNVVGRILDENGRPVREARVEIWQCDVNGRYHHPWDRRNAPLDPHFQGYGQFVTGADGGYRFRTIKPVPYPGRTPHIHFTISGPGFEPLITQMYVEGAPGNEGDFVLNRIRDPKARASVIVPFERVGDSPELLARFDVVLAADGRFGG